MGDYKLGKYEVIKIDNGIDKKIINKEILLNHTGLGKRIINFYASYGIQYKGIDNKEIFIPFCAPSPNQIILDFPDVLNFNNQDILFNREFGSIFEGIEIKSGGQIKSKDQDYMRMISSTLKGWLYYFDDENPEDENIKIFNELGLCKIADEYIKDEFAYMRFNEISKKLKK